MANALIHCITLQYIDMDDPKAALAKTLNQTALTQDGARAAMEGISPVLTQGVGTLVAINIRTAFTVVSPAQFPFASALS